MQTRNQLNIKPDPKSIMKNKKLLVVAVAVALSACQSPVSRKTFDTYNTNEANALGKLPTQNNGVQQEYEHVSAVYLGSKSVPLRTDLTLPDAFYQPKIFSAAGALTLSQAIAEISAKSGIPIRLASDVVSVSKDATASAPAPQATILLNSTTTTKAILDQVTSDMGLSWEYANASNTVIIQRAITRAFHIKSSIGDTTVTSITGSLSNTAQGGAGGGISTGFNSNVNVVNVSKINPLSSINDAVKTVLSPKGTSITTVTNSIIVTDTADAVDRAAKIVEREDEILSRNANVRVQIFSFVSNEADSAGLSITALYNSLGKYGYNITTPTSIVSQGAARFGANVLSSTTGATNADGSAVFFDLLAQRGRVAVVHDLNIPISNLNLYALSIPQQTKVLSRTTPSSGTIAGQTPGTPGLETENVTYGFKMSILGNILDSNTIKLRLNIGILDLQLREIVTGTEVRLTSPDLSGFELPADLTLKPNQTVVVTGFEHSVNRYNRNGVSQDLPLIVGGGSYAANETKEKYYILVTPTITGNTQ